MEPQQGLRPRGHGTRMGSLAAALVLAVLAFWVTGWSWKQGQTAADHPPNPEYENIKLAAVAGPLHVAPPRRSGPARSPDKDGICCGCLCGDPTWSCSQDTCFAGPRPEISDLKAEAGFFEIELQEYRLRGRLEKTPVERIWYAFRPARSQPEQRPLVVMFNGGPGSSSGPLFAFNTGEVGLDCRVPGEPELIDNPTPWTNWANLLWIDAPNTGFSYLLPTADGARPSPGIDPDRDAASFIRVITRFLLRHPPLLKNRVVLVGESWGGTRVALMMDKIFEYEDLPTMYPAADPELHRELRSYFAQVFPGSNGRNLPPQRLAEQWGHQVHIQSLLAGSAQESAMRAEMPLQPAGCIRGGDLYQCDEANGYTFDRIYDAAAMLVRPRDLHRALGVDPRTIAWLHAKHRHGAYGRLVGPREASRVDVEGMQNIFGRLGSGDAYYVASNNLVFRGYPRARRSQDANVGRAFLRSAYHSEVLLTNAARDRRIWSPAFARTFASYSDYVLDARWRSDRIELQLRAPEVGPVRRVELAFTSYPDAGHIVSLRQPRRLRDDIRAWYERTKSHAGRHPEAKSPLPVVSASP